MKRTKTRVDRILFHGVPLVKRGIEVVKKKKKRRKNGETRLKGYYATIVVIRSGKSFE